jgi:hypothetical protein
MQRGLRLGVHERRHLGTGERHVGDRRLDDRPLPVGVDPSSDLLLELLALDLDVERLEAVVVLVADAAARDRLARGVLLVPPSFTCCWFLRRN